MKRIVLVAALCLPSPSLAAIACEYQEAQVAEASAIIQIDQISVSPANAEGYCTITGTVQRSFKGDIAVGSEVTFANPCDHEPFPPGPQIITEQDALAAAPVIELHLIEGEVASYGAGLAVLDALTDAPARPNMCEG
jgi:hypothetical protein